ILLELRDQTERYAAEMRLRNSEEQFRGLAEALPQMVWSSDGYGNVDYFSQRWADFTGRPMTELMGRGFFDLIHPDDQTIVANAPERVATPGDPVMFRMRRADGAFRWMEARMDSAYDDDGTIVRTFGGTLDITDRREEEEEARRRQEQLRATLELTGYGTYVWYVQEDRFSRDSYQLEEILGLPMAELMKPGNAFDGFFAAVHPEDREMVQERVLAAVVPGGPDYEADFRMVVPERGGGPGTEERWVTAIGRAEFDDRGEPTRLVGVFADITSRRAEDDARLRLQKIEAMGTLASGIAHDFNNVIGAILSYARVAEVELKAGESPAQSIGEIARGARRAGDIVQRMLTFSREEAPRQVAFDLGDVVREAESLVRPTLPSSIDVTTTVEEELPRLVGDPTQLHQVVVNLLTNAGQAIGEDGGHIVVELIRTRCEEGQLTATTRDGTPVDCVRLRIRDDGPGMPAAIAQRVFDPFFTTKGPQKGTGLGLSAVQSIITNHGGAVNVESRMGEGAQFTVYLPVRELAPEPPAPEPVVEPGEELLRILFVDDEEALVRLAHRALPYRGCVVTGFTDPAEALHAFERDRSGFDAMITDFSMPGMTGLQLAEHVRSLRADIPIVLTSGYMRAEEHADAVRRGVDAVVPKPCSIDDLADTVEELIAARSSAE
ncbi:MAG: ATP-binding protein, partial [Solirubrobacteraceae bacterium]|nr:PAS domain-containing protein [Patulibacter sp.]